MATKLQTKLAHKRLTTIAVNGNTYNVDAECCIVVDDAADVKKLLSLGGEWSDKVSAISQPAPSRMPEPGKAMRTAAEFIELAAQDAEIGAKVSSFRSFASLSSFALGLGFKFTEAEFKLAGDAYAAASSRANLVKEENDAKMAKSDKKAKDSKKAEKPKAEEPKDIAKDFTSAEEDSGLPKRLPEETSGDWPDASAEMGLAYLRRMAVAYGVQYDPGVSKAELVKQINKAMYE